MSPSLVTSLLSTGLTKTSKSNQSNQDTATQPAPEQATPPTEQTDTLTLTNALSTSGQALLDGGTFLAKAAKKGAGQVAESVGKKLYNFGSRLAKDTAIMGGGAAIAAATSAVTLAVAGPLAALGVVAGAGVLAGVAHQVLAPPHPEDVGLSAGAKAHNRWVDSMTVGGLTTCAALVGLGSLPVAGGGITLAAVTGAIGGAIGSVINQTGEALGLLRA